MYYLQFYTKSAIDGKIVEACGDRSVLVVDGRYRQDNYKPEAVEHARKHAQQGFTHYSIFKGESFTRSKRIIDIIGIRSCEILEHGGDTYDCAKMYNCCDCGAASGEDGCGCRYCWSCNACDACKDSD